MGNYSKIFHKVPIQVPNKSGFDCSHENLLTAKCGTLVPIMVDPLLPNDSISLGSSLQVQLPPMASDFYGRVQLKLEAFFVPNRILYGGWQDFITHDNSGGPLAPGSQVVQHKLRRLPRLIIPDYATNPGSLADYLGFKRSKSDDASLFVVNNPLPFFAYHKIYDDWYRDRKLQVSAFTKDDFVPVSSSSIPTDDKDEFGYNPDVEDVVEEVEEVVEEFEEQTVFTAFGVTYEVPSGMTYSDCVVELDGFTCYFVGVCVVDGSSTKVYSCTGSDYFSIVDGCAVEFLEVPLLDNAMLVERLEEVVVDEPQTEVIEDFENEIFPGSGTIDDIEEILNGDEGSEAIEEPVTGSESPVAIAPNYSVAQAPYRGYMGDFGCDYFADGHYIYNLRQRNWPKDYFTNASPYPQAGEPMSVEFDTSGASGSFSIASLRAANALQQWLERNNLAGYLYGDQIKARFGIYPSDAITDRSLYLGSASVDVYTKSVFQTSASEQNANNPFNSVGSKFGSSAGVGQVSLVDNFTASEHGFIIVLASLVPNSNYSSGTRRYLHYSKPLDFPDPMLSGVGDQEIWKSELAHTPQRGPASGTFGYTQRFSESKFMEDEVHGLLRDGQSLDSFCLQRSFGSGVSLGADFLKIPKNYLDQVTAVSSHASQFGCWIDAYFKYHKASTLPAYSIPTLGDMKDTHTEIIDNGGKRL